MLTVVALTALAFAGPAPRAGARASRAVLRVSMSEDAPAPAPVEAEEAPEPAPAPPPPPPAVTMSQSVPFLVKQPNLEGLPGDVGFDPLGFSNAFPIDWLREAEIKHGRICMLATVGFVVPEFIHLPGRDFSSVAAHDANLATGAMSQLLLWLGLAEAVSLIAVIQMLEGSGRMPGDFGFDPLRLWKGKSERMRVAEIKNGRLAMLAFSGMVTQAALTGNGFPYIYS